MNDCKANIEQLDHWLKRMEAYCIDNLSPNDLEKAITMIDDSLAKIVQHWWRHYYRGGRDI